MVLVVDLLRPEWRGLSGTLLLLLGPQSPGGWDQLLLAPGSVARLTGPLLAPQCDEACSR